MKQFTIHEPFAHITEDQYVLEIHEGGSEEGTDGVGPAVACMRARQPSNDERNYLGSV